MTQTTQIDSGTGEVVEITSEAELRELLGEPKQSTVRKERRSLHPHDLAWIARSPFLLLATAGADGTCDVSPKGDPTGFVRVLDERTLAVPERPGNRRADGFRNVLANPHVGLIFLVPGRPETLRVNGRARLLADAPFFDDMVVRGHRPAVALLVHVEQVFFHCGRSFHRSGLWSPATWPAPDALPPFSQITKDTVDMELPPLDEIEQAYQEACEAGLYT